MPTTEPEVLDTLLNSQKSRDVVLLAYGLFGEKKVDWERHTQQQTGQRPTRPQIDIWISQKTQADFGGYLTQAEQILNRRQSPTTEMHRIGEEIISRVEDANSFFKQLRLAIATSVLTPIIVGGLLFVAVSYEKVGPYWEKFEQELHNLFVAKAAPMPPK
jgi:hypothetical protein